MKKIASFLFFSLLVLNCSYALLAQAKKSPKDLPLKYRKWLEEEVVYIITPTEKDVFLQFDTDREREFFIEAFWKARDPNPDTPENEFKIEHYRRINYANQYFGREGPGQGWRSDMGRIYIILGQPQQIDRYENLTEIYPFVIWFYEGKAELGLPNAFNVAFFKRSGVGEYELYSPVKFGPQSLMPNYRGDPGDYEAAYNELMDVDPNIAEVSLTFLPGERGQLLSPSIATEILVVNRIPSAPHQQVKDSYAKKLLAYKDIIEVDYTANYIENDADVLVLTDKSGIAFVHYLIEPRKLTFEQLGRRFKTNLEINGKIADLGGTTIYQFDRSIPIEFDQDRFDNIRSKLFSFQDVFPLVEGRYKLNILLKNIVSKEFTSVERDIIVPGPSALQFSPLLLANRIVTGSDYKGKTKAFLVGDLQLVPSPRNDFTSQDKLFLYFQVLGMSPELQAGGILEYTILREEEKVLSRSRNIRDLPDKTNFFEEFSLAELSSGYYKIKVSLFDQNSKELLFEQADFFISHLASLPRPWVLSLPMPPAEDSLFTNIRGNQWENKKDLARAKKLLAQAYRENPRSAKFALDYCRVLFKEKDYPQVKAVAAPFLNAPERNEFLAVLGQSSQALGEMEQAIAFYKEYLDHYGANLLILNAVGECYWKMGNAEEALLAFERSLQINPKQEEIQKIVKAIKEKK